MSDSLTIVIKFSDEQSRQKMISSIKMGNDFCGGTISSSSLFDEMKALEKYECKYGELEEEID